MMKYGCCHYRILSEISQPITIGALEAWAVVCVGVRETPITIL